MPMGDKGHACTIKLIIMTDTELATVNIRRGSGLEMRLFTQCINFITIRFGYLIHRSQTHRHIPRPGLICSYLLIEEYTETDIPDMESDS